MEHASCVPTDHDLASALHRIDGRPYPAYKDLRGRYDFRRFTLSGWKSSDTTMIYGYMYLYDGFGRQFNGMEVTFEKEE